jgi:DNA repair protein RecO (recombination protein O)
MPQLFSCAGCEREVEEGESCFFSQEMHGILCESCARRTRDAVRISGGALYAMRYIVSAPMGRLYGFQVTEEILLELEHIVHIYVSNNTDRRFKSLDILEVMAI